MYYEPLSPEQEFLRSVRVGMDVYDLDHHRIGKVMDFHFADDIIEAVPSGVDDDLADLQGVVRARLVQAGYIKIEGGFLRSDRYVMADQIVYVDDEAVYLNVVKDSLIRA